MFYFKCNQIKTKFINIKKNTSCIFKDISTRISRCGHMETVILHSFVIILLYDSYRGWRHWQNFPDSTSPFFFCRLHNTFKFTSPAVRNPLRWESLKYIGLCGRGPGVREPSDCLRENANSLLNHAAFAHFCSVERRVLPCHDLSRGNGRVMVKFFLSYLTLRQFPQTQFSALFR